MLQTIASANTDPPIPSSLCVQYPIRQESSWMMTIPDDLLFEIFSFIETGADVSIAGRTCRQWYKVSRDNVIWKRLFEVHFPESYKERLKHKKNVEERNFISKNLTTRWKALYTEHSERMWCKKKLEMMDTKCQVVDGVTLIFNIFDCSEFQKYRCLEKFYSVCSELKDLMKKISETCKLLKLTCLHISFVHRSKGWHWEERELYLYIGDSENEWKKTLLNKDFDHILRLQRHFRDIVSAKEDSFQRAAKILNIRYLSCTDETLERAMVLVHSILTNEHRFEEFKKREKLNLFVFIDDHFTSEEYIQYHHQTFINIPYYWSLDEVVEFLRFDAVRLERIIAQHELQREKERKELQDLEEKAKKQLHLSSIETHYSLDREHIVHCLQNLLKCDPEVQLAIQKEKFDFFITDRNYMNEMKDRVAIPWDFSCSELESILKYEHRYFLDQ